MYASVVSVMVDLLSSIKYTNATILLYAIYHSDCVYTN